MTTTTDEAAAEIVLRLNPDGPSTLTHGTGKPEPIPADTIDEARTAGLAHVLERAASTGRAVRFDAHDPDGHWQLLGHPDGQITEYHQGQEPKTVSEEPTVAPAETTNPTAAIVPSVNGQQAPVPTYTCPSAARAGLRLDLRDGPDRSSDPHPQGHPRLAGMLGLGPSKREREERADRVAACQTFGRPVTVVVADPRGGSGKTTTSILLAGAFGNARGGGVLVLENHELRGTMHLRTHAQGKDRTIRDLLGAQNYRGPSGEVVRIGELSAYARHQVAGQFDVMVSETKRDRALTREEFESVHDLGSRFYSVIIVDTANDESAENWRAAVQRADALVVPLKWRNDYSLPAIEMLEELQGSGDPRLQDLVRRTVVVASHNHGDLDARCQQHLKPYFLERTKAVIEITPDPHIAEGNVIEHDQLSAATRRQAERLAAEVAHAIRASLDGTSRSKSQ